MRIIHVISIISMAEPSTSREVSGDSSSESESKSGEECEGPGSVPSLLEKLCAPKPSELARKR